MTTTIQKTSTSQTAMDNGFAKLGLHSSMLNNLDRIGYQQPTAIQAQAIPAIIKGKDILAGSQTGTGKTAAFALGLLKKIADKPSIKGIRKPQALLLVPTRELAQQVGSSIKNYAGKMPLKHVLLVGGVKIQPQTDALKRHCDVITATPGRLIDHIRQGHVDLSAIETLVLDEADRMLDMGFIEDIKTIITKLPQHRQHLMFSATYGKSVMALAKTILHNPVMINVAKTNRVSDAIKQSVIAVDDGQKLDLLCHLIESENMHQVLIFARTKQQANTLAYRLSKSGLECGIIHGDKTQAQRRRALKDFQNHQTRILVATDVASRGIDIETLPFVINYQLPFAQEDYLHRIGRTGRAGNTGQAISLVSKQEYRTLQAIERLLNIKIPRTQIPGFTSSYRLADNQKFTKNKQRQAKSAKKSNTISKRIPRSSSRKKDDTPESYTRHKLDTTPAEHKKTYLKSRRRTSPQRSTQETQSKQGSYRKKGNANQSSARFESDITMSERRKPYAKSRQHTSTQRSTQETQSKQGSYRKKGNTNQSSARFESNTITSKHKKPHAKSRRRESSKVSVDTA